MKSPTQCDTYEEFSNDHVMMKKLFQNKIISTKPFNFRVGKWEVRQKRISVESLAKALIENNSFNYKT